MCLSESCHILLSLALLVSSTVIPRGTVDPDNPEASDPTQPPKKLNRPLRADNWPFKDGFETKQPLLHAPTI